MNGQTPTATTSTPSSRFKTTMIAGSLLIAIGLLPSALGAVLLAISGLL